MEETESKEPTQNEITLKELKKYLEEEKPPTDDKEDIGIDKDVADFSINSTFSEDEDRLGSGYYYSPGKSTASKLLENLDKKPALNLVSDATKQEEADISVGEISDVISNPYAEMPEFYPKQLDFDPVEGLPGAQKHQLEHKKKTVLKNKYWERVLKNVYDMATAEVPRPTHLTKILELYIINQEKLKEKRKDQLMVKPEDQPQKMRIPGRGISRKTLPVGPMGIIPSSLDTAKRTSGSGHPMVKKKERREPTQYAGSITTISRGSVSPTASVKFLHGMNPATSHAASSEIQKRIEKLDKVNIKISPEELAKETKNLLIRMPPYKKQDFDTFSSADVDTTYPKMLTKYIFAQGFIEKWKNTS